MTSHLYADIDFRTAVRLRAFQSVGLAFLFVPINTLIFATVPPQKNNAVSGIVNLARNMGGDVGIAFVTTLIARRSQLHQVRLTSHTTAYDAGFATTLGRLTAALERAGVASADAGHKAMAILYRQTLGQAATLAFLDAIRILGIATALMLPLLFLTRRPKAGGGAPSGH
jgi:DHA2 family multidrug resistance protein